MDKRTSKIKHTYEVSTESGSVWKRHLDQIRDSNAKQTCLNTHPELQTAENENLKKTQNKYAKEPNTSEARRHPIRSRKQTKRLIKTKY